MALPEPPFQVLVIQAYTPREKTDLAFRKDEILTVLEVDARGQRFRATRDPKAKKPPTGWLPMYYVRVVDMMSDKEKKAVAVATAPAAPAGKSADAGAKKEHASVAELVETGDAKKLAKAIRKGRSLEEPNAAGKTGLQIAAEKGDAETVTMLIKAGAQVNTADSRGWTPLHFAALNTRTDVCEVLLRANAEPNAQTAESGTTALHLLVRANWSKDVERALALLVQRSANLELKNKYGETALHQAVSRLNSEGIAFLIKHGADLNARNEFGETSLHKAARIGKPAKDVIKQLLAAGCDASIEGRNGTAADLIDFDTHPELRELFPEEDDASSSSGASDSEEEPSTPSPAPLHLPSHASDEPAIAAAPRAWVSVSAAQTGDKSPRPGGLGTLGGSSRLLGPPPARTAPLRSPAGGTTPVGSALPPPIASPPPIEAMPVPPPRVILDVQPTEVANSLPPPPTTSPAAVRPSSPPSNNSYSAPNSPAHPAGSNTLSVSSPAVPIARASPERPEATSTPPPGSSPASAARKQTAKISMIQNAYLQQVEAHQKVDQATLMHREAIAKRRGISPSKERPELSSAPSFFQQNRAPRDLPNSTPPLPPSPSTPNLRIPATVAPTAVRPAVDALPPPPSVSVPSLPPPSDLPPAPPPQTSPSSAASSYNYPTPSSSTSATVPTVVLPPPPSLSPPPELKSPTTATAKASSAPIPIASPRDNNNTLSANAPALSGSSPASTGTSPSLSNSASSASSASTTVAAPQSQHLKPPSNQLMAVASQRRMSRKQRGSRLIKASDNSLASAERDLEKLTEAEKVAETASALEERAFVWRATQHLDAEEIRNQMAKIAATEAPSKVAVPAAAAKDKNNAPKTPEGVYATLPSLISETHGFWIESGAANANPDVGVNMSDFTDFYKMYFYGRKQCNFVGYLPVMKANTSNPTIVSVLEEAEPDKLEKLSHRGLIRTKSGVDHFYVNAEAFAKATHSVKGKFVDKMGKYLADTYFPGSQLWPVREKEQVQTLEQELLVFEEKDPERVPCFAFAIVYAKEGDKTAIDMMNHEHSSPGFDEFIDWLGDRVELRGWSGFKGGLDVRGDAKGTHSIYTKYMNKFEIMFHVSTLLPYHELDPLKLVRTRQVQNDVLMLIYMEGNGTYDPLIMPTNVTHCFVIVNPVNVNGEQMYRVNVVSRSVVPHFTPELPYPPLFKRNDQFRSFLLNKLLNGQMAARKSGLHLMYTRPRQAMIRDIINKYIAEKDRQNTQLG